MERVLQMGTAIMGKRKIPIKATKSELGKKMRAKRAAEGWTVRDAAQRIGIAGSGISDLENGNRSPDWETLIKIHEGTGIPLDDLVRAAAADWNVKITERSDPEIIRALDARTAAFPDLIPVLRRLERADPAKYRSFLKMFDVFDQDDDALPP